MLTDDEIIDIETMNSADYYLAIPILIKEVLELRSAVRKHRDEKGHDRCWLDDMELYKALPEGVADVNLQLPPEKEFLANCKRFYDSRKDPNESFLKQIEQSLENVLENGYEIKAQGITIFSNPRMFKMVDGKFIVHCKNNSDDKVFDTAKEAAQYFLKKK